MSDKGSGSQVAKRTPMDLLKSTLNADSVQAQFRNALEDNAGPFIASIIDLVGSDKTLQQCDPNLVIMECLKAATLKLPINRQLGFAWIIPYKVQGTMTPQFQMGYRGYIQLAMRTGQYRFLNAGTIMEGVNVTQNRLTGQVDFSGTASSDKVQGYFAYLELLNGFSKSVYMTRAEVEAHAKRFSKSFGSSTSPWKTDFDAMAIKTVLRQLLSKYGVMSIEMASALSTEGEDAEDVIVREIAGNAHVEVLEEGIPDGVDGETGEIQAPQGEGQPSEGQAGLPDWAQE